MSLNDEVELLRRLPLFSSIEPARLKLLAFASVRLTFARGQTLFRQGDVGDAAYVVLSGTAEVVVGPADRAVHLASIGPNSIIGEIAVLCDVPRTATVLAESDLEVLQIKKERFSWLIKEFPEISIEIMRMLATRLSERTTELADPRSMERKTPG